MEAPSAPSASPSAPARSEKEKMLAGELYHSFGEELFGERTRARQLLLEYNTRIDYSDAASRARVLGQLLGAMDPDNPPFIEPPFRCDYGWGRGAATGSGMGVEWDVACVGKLPSGCGVVQHPCPPCSSRGCARGGGAGGGRGSSSIRPHARRAATAWLADIASTGIGVHYVSHHHTRTRYIPSPGSTPGPLRLREQSRSPCCVLGLGCSHAVG